MLELNKRKAVYALHQEGLSAREIARRLCVGRNTIRRIIARKGEGPSTSHRRRIQLDEELLRSLFTQCAGRAQRVYEKLVEEHKFQVSYTSVTRLLRELHLRTPLKTRCHHVDDVPGAEMQHDTTVYQVPLGERREKVIASVLYLRYSKRRYLKFYRAFNRFRMKCFFHEALAFWGCSAKECIIDNTNLARLRGAGAQALMVPEMSGFARQYGFTFRCHALGHANRKAGEERSFYTVETNFLAGRTFQNMEDLNAQAFEWATVRMYHRPVGKSRLIPVKAFEHECLHLSRVPAELCAPYLELARSVDQYGFVACEGNYYWVPGEERHPAKVLLYDRRLEIYSSRRLLASYPLPPEWTKNQSFSPPGQGQPLHYPNNRKRPTQNEERQLRTLGVSVVAYLDLALSPKGAERHRLVRMLFTLWRQTSPELFEKIVARALRFGVTDPQALDRIAILLLNQDGAPIPNLSVHEDLQERKSFQDGLWTDPPDFSLYDRLLDQPLEQSAEQQERTNG
jgi:transposase